MNQGMTSMKDKSDFIEVGSSSVLSYLLLNPSHHGSRGKGGGWDSAARANASERWKGAPVCRGPAGL